MKFSRFNYLFNSPKHGFFVYNSTNNSFHKINEGLFSLLKRIQADNSAIKELDEEFLNKLISMKIIVDQNADDDFVKVKKFLHYSKSFSLGSLGVVIVPTMNCNFRCPYCYEANLPKNKMNKDIQDKLIQFIENSKYGSKNVNLCWHGGEPLLAFDVMERILERIYNSDKIKVQTHDLVTNGYLLDPSKVNILKKYNLNSIQITIDGHEETHNESRPLKSGLPTYHKIIENIEYILTSFPECKVKVRINVHKENQKDFPSLFKELKQKWGKFNCNIYMIYVSDNENCKVKCIKLNERVEFLRNLYQHDGIKEVKFYPIAQELGCTATYQNSFIIGVKGELYKCWVDVGKPNKIIGTLDEPMANLPLLSSYIIGSDMFNDEKCLKCFLFPICDGGCCLLRYENMLNNKDNDLCPIDINDMQTLLELHYEQHIK